MGLPWLTTASMYINFKILGQKPPDKKTPDTSHPDKSPPTISPRYKCHKKNRCWIFVLGLVDPSRNRLASTAYFAIISSIILGGLFSGGFCPRGLCPRAFCRGLLTGYLMYDTYFQKFTYLHQRVSQSKIIRQTLCDCHSIIYK